MSEPCVRKWLARCKNDHTYRVAFRLWLLWLWTLPEWSGQMPSELLNYQEKMNKIGGRDEFTFTDLIQSHCQERGGTYMSMIVRASILRMFFVRNRVPFPEFTDWNPQPTRESVTVGMNVEQVREIINHADLRGKAIFLTMFQGIMDRERFRIFNLKYAEKLVEHIKAGKFDEPFRIDYVGRKKNKRPYHTFIHRDSLMAWKNYFQKERGYPKPAEPIAVTYGRGSRYDTAQHAIGKEAVAAYFTRLARQLKIKPPPLRGLNANYQRTGIAPHEAFRDVVVSLLEQATTKGYNKTCSDFWMGHSIDKYNYNRFAEKDPKYELDQAGIASQYLNILTVAGKEQENSEELRRLQAELESVKLSVSL